MSSLYIAQVKKKCGIETGENHNLPKSEDARQPQCPKEKENEIKGFIDLGKMGPADRWQDIAIAIRSLQHNFDGTYTDGKKLFDFEPQMNATERVRGGI